MFELTEQRVCVWPGKDKLELETIKRQVEDESQGKIRRRQDVAVEAETVETNVGTVEEEINGSEDSIGDTEEDVNEEQRTIVEQLNEIMEEDKTGDAIMIKKVNEKVLKFQTDRVNEVAKYLKSKSITWTKNLIRAASVWVAEGIGLKKAEHRKMET